MCVLCCLNLRRGASSHARVVAFVAVSFSGGVKCGVCFLLLQPALLLLRAVQNVQYLLYYPAAVVSYHTKPTAVRLLFQITLAWPIPRTAPSAEAGGVPYSPIRVAIAAASAPSPLWSRLESCHEFAKQCAGMKIQPMWL